SSDLSRKTGIGPCSARSTALRAAPRPRAPAPPLLLRSVAWGSSFLPVVPRAPGEHRSIAPQPLELVEFPQLGAEHMHYEIHVVEQHPPPLRQPLPAPRPLLVIAPRSSVCSVLAARHAGLVTPSPGSPGSRVGHRGGS